MTKSKTKINTTYTVAKPGGAADERGSWLTFDTRGNLTSTPYTSPVLLTCLVIRPVSCRLVASLPTGLGVQQWTAAGRGRLFPEYHSLIFPVAVSEVFCIFVTPIFFSFFLPHFIASALGLHTLLRILQSFYCFPLPSTPQTRLCHHTLMLETVCFSRHAGPPLQTRADCTEYGVHTTVLLAACSRSVPSVISIFSQNPTCPGIALLSRHFQTSFWASTGSPFLRFTGLALCKNPLR